MTRTIDELEARAEGEREFYDALARKDEAHRGLVDRLAEGFYDKGDRGVWAPVWRQCHLEGARVLDYCSGDGQFSARLLGRGAAVTGIDISPELVALASRRCRGGRASFVVGDAHALPFADGSFDFVFGNGCLHHLDLGLAYGEIARVLKPGGRAYFMEPLYHHPALWLLRRLTPWLRSPSERPLSFAGIERARRNFGRVRHREHYLLAVAAAPAHWLGLGVARRVIGVLDRLDGVLMGICPPLRRLAWLTMIEMEKQP